MAHESGVTSEVAITLVNIAQKSRNLKGFGLDEGASTRMLIYAGKLIVRGLSIPEACQIALVLPITDDPQLRDSLSTAISACI